VAIAAWMMPDVRERMHVLLSPGESSNAARLEGWKGGVRVWLEHPVWGSGPDTFFQAFRRYRSVAYQQAAGFGVTQAHAHNDIVQMAATEGILGLLAYGWIIILALRQAVRVSESSGVFWALSLLGLVIQNQFNFSSVGTSVWAAVGLAILFGSEKQVSEVPVPTIFRAQKWLIGVSVAAGFWVVSQPICADWHYKQGLIANQMNRPQEALAQFRLAAKENSHNEVYPMELSNTAKTCGFFDEAWRESQESTHRHPFNPDEWNNQGVAAMWMTQAAHIDKMTDAQTAFEKAVALDPLFVDAWANLAKWEHLAGHLDRERQLWQKVLEIDSHHIMARQVLGIR
jgi:tetratricopeptide (TPR) repeat protein